MSLLQALQNYLLRFKPEPRLSELSFPNPTRQRAGDLGPAQIKWLRKRHGIFKIAERQAIRAARSTRKSRECVG